MSAIPPYTITLDEVVFQLQEHHDFKWIRELGRVIRVFDRQDSGNISFAVRKDGETLFVKYAGARGIAYTGEPHTAIRNLKSAVPLYDELSHPALVQMVDHYETGAGYVAVFSWFEGESLHPHDTFPPPAKYTHPESPFFQFRQLSVQDRLASLDTIFSFHEHVEQKGYVAVDFYDGSLMYDFARKEMKICDIDLYRKKPFINTMGRLWGSSRFMSPEEFTSGAEIDGRSNVFVMGATAFALLGGERDRSLSKWEAGRELYEVAARAVRPERSERYGSISEFKAAWDEAQKRS
ncbi:serine/threonine protein kinase [Paenibacillus sp. GD4]|nr:serine/threonine protein kinase [Paenibacillus sp. GD4]MDQ1914447.1 serine/threonine protein kinase [Paenibacillus sp. GD4]